MDDVVAVALTTDSGQTVFFMTWGRIQDKVNPEPLQALVMTHAHVFALPGVAVSARVCDVLAEARDAPLFYEALLRYPTTAIPYGEETYWPWRDRMREEMQKGKQLFYLGAWPDGSRNKPAT